MSGVPGAPTVAAMAACLDAHTLGPGQKRCSCKRWSQSPGTLRWDELRSLHHLHVARELAALPSMARRVYKQPRGVCDGPECGQEVALLSDGTVRAHGSGSRAGRCPGSHQPPRQGDTDVAVPH